MPNTVHGALFTSPTRCIAVKVVPKTGTTWGLTDHNAAFVWGGITYQSAGGIDVSTLVEETGTSPNNLEVTTIESAILSQITQSDLIAGKYEGATVTVYEVDYANTANYMIRGKYRFTKATLGDTSSKLTLKETLSLLQLSTGAVLESTCPVTQFGNKVCDPGQTIRAAMSFSRTVATVYDIFTMAFAADSHASGYFTAGEAICTSGANAGLSGNIKSHLLVSGTAQIILETPFGLPVSPGDVFTLVFGCDRKLATCKTVTNSGTASGTNVENFQAYNLPIPDAIHVVGRQPGT